MIGPILAHMRTARSVASAVSVAALCLFGLAGCQRSTHSHVQLVATVPPAERSLTLGAGDALGWEVRHQDAAMAATTASDATRVATGQ